MTEAPFASTLPESGTQEATLLPEQVRERAVAGVAMVGLRGLLIKAIGFAVNIVLARFLAPQDFGVLAVGQAFVTFVSFFSDGGVAGAVIRRHVEPTRRELRAVAGFQLILAAVFTASIAAVAVNFGRTGDVTAIIVLSLPLTVLRTPATVQLERRLDYHNLAMVEVAETMIYCFVAVTSVLLGAGVWGVACSLLVKAAVGSLVLRRLSRVQLGLLPVFDWTTVRPLLSFGFKYIAATAVNTLRIQVVNVATAAIAGVATLGYFSLADRVLLVPFLLFEALGRVSMPAMSRLVESTYDPRPDIRRSLKLGAIITGFALVGLAGGAPSLVPGVFGSVWRPSVPVIPVGTFGFMIVGPVSVAFGGYLYAKERAGRMLVIMIAYAAAMLGIGLTLLPIIGVLGLAVGSMCASVAEAILLTVSMRRYGSFSVVRNLSAPVLAATAGALAGLEVTQHFARSLGWGVAAAATATVVYVGCLCALDCHALVSTVRLIVRALGVALRPRLSRPSASETHPVPGDGAPKLEMSP